MDKITATKIKKISENFFNSALKLHVSMQCSKYLFDKAIINWREFESEISINYPIKGIGIIGTRMNMENPDSSEGGFLYTDEPLGGHEVTDELQGFPFETAAAAYLFTALEIFGDEISEILVGPKLRQYDSWHKFAGPNLDFSDKKSLASVAGKIAKIFNTPISAFSENFVSRLVLLKIQRNRFAHVGDEIEDFEQFFEDVILVALAIYFAVLPNEKKIKVYPYQDLERKFK